MGRRSPRRPTPTSLSGMSDHGRYDSAMFWLAFGTAAAVIGLALMTIGVTTSVAGANLFESRWFDAGCGLLVLGSLLLLWALGLYLARRRTAAQASQRNGLSKDQVESQAVKGYYDERQKLFRIWERQEREKARRKK